MVYELNVTGQQPWFSMHPNHARQYARLNFDTPQSILEVDELTTLVTYPVKLATLLHYHFVPGHDFY